MEENRWGYVDIVRDVLEEQGYSRHEVTSSVERVLLQLETYYQQGKPIRKALVASLLRQSIMEDSRGIYPI